MTEHENKYWAFLSYSPQDNCAQRPDAQEACRLCWGDWLRDALKAFAIPADFVGQINGRGEIIPERIHPIFQDEQAQPEAASLDADSREALEQSICLVVICSPRSAQSPRVNEAVRYFKQLGRGKHILPIVIAGEPHASAGNKPGLSPEDECFVPALRHPVQPDGTLDTTRRAGRFIFVDARHGAEKREILAKDHRTAEADLEMAKIQLIALLIGVGFNGLWWREQKRHFFDFAEAQHQAREAFHQVEEVRLQLQEAQRQTREAQDKALELQNLPRDVHGQIQEAQNQAREARHQAQEAHKQLQEIQNKVRTTQTQLEEAQLRALAAEGKVLEAQHQARETQNQLEATRIQARETQNTVLELQNLTQAVPSQMQAAQSQLAETRQQVQDAQDKYLTAQSQVQEFQNQARSAQSQLEEARQQVRAAQSQALEAQDQARAAQRNIEEIKSQTRAAQNQLEETRNAARAAQNKVQEVQTQSQAARRLTKIFAVMAVLALMAAGAAYLQRKSAAPALAGPEPEPLRQVLQNIGGAEQARRLDLLAAGIPQAEIPEALKASSVLLNDQQRSHFQKWLLVRLGWVNPVSAMACAGAIEGKIVNEAGADDSSSYFQLAVLDRWMQTDLPGAFNWVCQLPDADARQRALEKIIPALIAHDPAQAIQQWQQIPDPAPGDTVLRAILTAWITQQPEAALNWVKSQPDSEFKNKALEICMGEQAKTDVPKDLDLPPEIMQPRTAPMPWTKFLQNSYFGGPTLFPVETGALSNTTNDPLQLNPAE